MTAKYKYGPAWPLYTHNALQRTVNYGVVIISRNLEKTNENDGFKITALETQLNYPPHKTGPTYVEAAMIDIFKKLNAEQVYFVLIAISLMRNQNAR